MSKRSYEGEPHANKKAASLVATLKTNRMTPSGYQKVDVIDTLFHALRTAQVATAADCCRELDCEDVWVSLLSFCTRESPNALASTVKWFSNFHNNRPHIQVLGAQDMSSAVCDICTVEHDTEPFCSLLLSSAFTSLQNLDTTRCTDVSFIQMRDLFFLGENLSMDPKLILEHFWTSFQSMDLKECAIAVLAFFKLQEEGMECKIPYEKNRICISRVKKIINHWLNSTLVAPTIRFMVKNPITLFYVLMSSCMAQQPFKKANKVSDTQHEAAHSLLLDAVEFMVLPNKLEPVQTCIGVCCAIFNIFKGSPPHSTAPSCAPIVFNEWTEDLQEIVQKRTLTVHRQLRHLRPLEESVPKLAAALTPAQINMSHDLGQKHSNLVFFDDMIGHNQETREECRTIYNRAISASSYTFDVRKPYVITKFLLSQLDDSLSEMYSKFE